MWPLAALCFGAGWWCCGQAHLWLEEQLVVAAAEAAAQGAARGD